jgi:hypothetical protein
MRLKYVISINGLDEKLQAGIFQFNIAVTIHMNRTYFSLKPVKTK